MSDTIFIKPGESVPYEPASISGYIKHVHCDGARFHVPHWSTTGEHCSEVKCIKNYREPAALSRDVKVS